MDQEKYIEMFRERIEHLIKDIFYYIEYPSGVPEYIWKDGNGNYQHMNEMGLDHLKACIRLIDKNMKWFEESNYKSEILFSQTKKGLFPLIDKKRSELDKIFNHKVKM